VAEEPSEKPSVVESAPRVATHRGTPRILVVDDEETILDLSVDILESRGYEVDTASTGEIAREKIASNPYDLVIADIRMPGMLSGIDLFHWAQRHMPGFEEKIVFATGDIVADDTQKFLSETNRPCLTKPFEMTEYLDTVRAAIAVSQSVN
jgi:CheY-like chemotaxis protein